MHHSKFIHNNNVEGEAEKNKQNFNKWRQVTIAGAGKYLPLYKGG